MTTTGESYRASGAFNAVSTLTASIGGLIAALVVAGIVWAWERSPIPTLVILTPILQGFALGFVLALLFGVAKLRNPALGLLIGLICGAVSVAAVHYGHYVKDVYAYRDDVKAEQAKIVEALGPEGAQALLARTQADPFKAFDEDITYPENGKRGFVGHLLLRAEQGVRIKSADVTGIGMWILWGIEALMVLGIAAVMGRSRAAEPFCENCDRWCEKSETPTILPPDKAEPLSALVQKGDALGLAALRSTTPQFDVSTGFAGVAVHTCPACDDGYADVVLHSPGKDGKTEEKKLATLVHASKDMLAALRADVKPAQQGAGAIGTGATSTTT